MFMDMNYYELESE